MIDIDKLQMVADRAIEIGAEKEQLFSDEEVISVFARLRQAEKDAARYRWLRESASTEDHEGFAYNFRLVDAIRYMPGAAPNETMDVDSAIDEAMKCSK